MKRSLFYLSPFLLVPFLLLFCEALDDAGLIPMNVYLLGAILLLCSLGMGLCSPSRRAVDPWLTALMPLALFCSMLAAGFLDKDDLETRFHLSRALEAAVQSPVLLLYALMALTTLLASWRGFRKRKTK